MRKFYSGFRLLLLGGLGDEYVSFIVSPPPPWRMPRTGAASRSRGRRQAGSRSHRGPLVGDVDAQPADFEPSQASTQA